MLFLKRILARWVSEGSSYDEDRVYPEPTNVRNGHGRGRGTLKSSNNVGGSEEFKNPLNITLYNAVGGKIIKFHSYDYNSDTGSETTYVIDNEENFEEALGKFIAMEALKHNG